MKTSVRSVLALVIALTLSALAAPVVAKAQVDGMTYTSPLYGYQLQWSSPWFFVEEISDSGTDGVFLSDGESQATLAFGFSPGVTAFELLTYIPTLIPPEITNFQPMVDAQGQPLGGGDAERAWAVYTGTQALPDGSTLDIAVFFDVRMLPGGVNLAISSTTASYFYDGSQLQTWQDLADSALVVDEPEPTPTESSFPFELTPTPAPVEPTTPADQRPDTPSVETPTPVAPDVNPGTPSGVGESAPAFASGAWRVSVRAVDTGETVEYLGLGFVDSSQWVVVFADVSNWSEVDETLNIADLQLASSNGPIAPDVQSSQNAAQLLGLEPASGGSVTIPGGGSTRVVLVYSIPNAQSDLILTLGEQQLPLADAVGRQLDVTDLQTIVPPPSTLSAVVTGLNLDLTTGASKLVLEIDGQEVMVSLAGAELPLLADCFDPEASMLSIAGLSGTTVYLEADSAIAEPDTYYVWIEDEAGNRVLLNQQLIDEGLAVEGDLPESARFGAWIEQTEETARASGVGLWTACAGIL